MTVQSIKHTPLYILYGSETGNAESIAKRIYEESIEKDYPAQLLTLNKFKRFLQKEYDNESKANLVIVCSTTGNGDPPENAELYWRFIKRRTKPNTYLQHFTYGVLALGDQNYDKFCNAGKNIDLRMNELSAQRFCKRGEADEQLGLEQVVEPWLQKLWQHLKVLYQQDEPSPSLKSVESEESLNDNSSVYSNDIEDDKVSTTTTSSSLESPVSKLSSDADDTNSFTTTQYNSALSYLNIVKSEKSASTERERDDHFYHLLSNRENFGATLKNARYLTEESSSKSVLHLELDISGSGIKYRPGDAIGIVWENDERVVNELVTKLQGIGSIAGIDPENDYLSIQCKNDSKQVLYPQHISQSENDAVTLREILSKRVDIMSPVTMPLLKILSKYCTDRNERQTLFQYGFDPNAYKSHIVKQHANLCDVLNWFPSCVPPLAHLLQELPSIQPRYYSITSSQLKHPNEIHIAFTIVQFTTPPPNNMKKVGCCTSWLQTQAKQLSSTKPKIPIFLKSSPEFRLPEQTHTPIIMIGPGTGVCPYKSFLEEREQLLDQTDTHNNWLFFGCRNKKTDFLYNEEFTSFENSPLNLKLTVASSRVSQEIKGTWYGGAYVQDYMQSYASDIVHLMNEKGAYLYVCGDANSMASQVNQTLHQIIENERNCSPEQAKQILNQWEKQGRYQRDVWA